MLLIVASPDGCTVVNRTGILGRIDAAWVLLYHTNYEGGARDKTAVKLRTDLSADSGHVLVIFIHVLQSFLLCEDDLKG